MQNMKIEKNPVAANQEMVQIVKLEKKQLSVENNILSQPNSTSIQPQLELE